MIYGSDLITADYISREVARGKQYFLVLLHRGPRERNDATLLGELQHKHLQHMFALREAGKLVLNGPCLTDDNLRGICIFAISSPQEVTRFVSADPMVEAGFLEPEIFPWMGLPGDHLP
jgi:uncharacterized protein YciI